MTIAEIKNKLTSLGISSTEPIIVGSSILDILGVRPGNDVDLLISKKLFTKLLAMVMKYYNGQMVRRK